MKFSIQLSADYPDKAYGGDRVYQDMLAQATLADRLGFDAVAITEHHLMNCLMMPAPLQFAVKIAAHTEQIKIITAITILPIRDMRVFAGEVVVADIFTEGRLLLGVGRGNFTYEMERLGIPMSETRERFDESLDVLRALLTREEVSWDGNYYKFDPITIMPRPMNPGGPQMMMAAVNPEAIYHSAKAGYHVQTTPMVGSQSLVREQIESFHRGKEECGEAGKDLTLTLLRVGYMCHSEMEKRERIQMAHAFMGRFENVYGGPGLVDNGMVRALPRRQPIDQLAKGLLIGMKQEMIDKLSAYDEMGVDRIIMNVNFGCDPHETMDSIRYFAEEVMPHFAKADSDFVAA
ncbi:MAG: LLM class flavin-dependent oxidoreductase [Pseudomonadota bacterium]|jgi:alkanesulfonate monooxygenase SsuD/methylene tetrahydromethanopterin reductase-like flavin-dependent oxidoreductase (luciferase family)|nr:LLM class flavin-dependent oxidoreductase [Pseudomonadota bacterium]MEC8643233.1 LLM class flavin-dependent oxidoreductase [Pseudomonadota bacterium]